MQSSHTTIAVVSISAVLASTLLAGCAPRGGRFESRMRSLPSAEEIMDRRDDDGDLLLTFDEFKDGARGDAEQIFERVDANEDGFADLEELRRVLEALRSRAGR